MFKKTKDWRGGGGGGGEAEKTRGARNSPKRLGRGGEEITLQNSKVTEENPQPPWFLRNY